jgi:hypothetical protein
MRVGDRASGVAYALISSSAVAAPGLAGTAIASLRSLYKLNRPNPYRRPADTPRIQNMNDVLKKIGEADAPANVLSAAGIFDYNKATLLSAFGEDIYARRFARYVLLRLECLYFNHTSILNLPDELSVEHILPQTPASTSQWVHAFSESDRNQWLHKLGNLMLLSRRKNTSLGNLDFVDKKCRYFQNNVETLPNSARVLTLQAFMPTAVQIRHQELLMKLSTSY